MSNPGNTLKPFWRYPGRTDPMKRGGLAVLGALVAWWLIRDGSEATSRSSPSSDVAVNGSASGTSAAPRPSTPPRRLPGLPRVTPPTADHRPVHYRVSAKDVFGPTSEEFEDKRRNMWEELQSYREAARLTEDQWARLLDDLADLAAQHDAWSERRARPLDAPSDDAGISRHYTDLDDQVEVRLDYLDDRQWRIYRRRFSEILSVLPSQLATLAVLERG